MKTTAKDSRPIDFEPTRRARTPWWLFSIDGGGGRLEKNFLWRVFRQPTTTKTTGQLRQLLETRTVNRIRLSRALSHLEIENDEPTDAHTHARV